MSESRLQDTDIAIVGMAAHLPDPPDIAQDRQNLRSGAEAIRRLDPESLPDARGYIFKEGEILSPDGHCHAFDHRAQVTVFGSGAVAVVLRRLKDAIADGDHIWAVKGYCL